MPARSSAPSNKGIKHTKKWRPGTVALREIRRYQKSVDLLLARKPFQMLVRQIAQECKANVRFQFGALLALQEAAEMHIVLLFEDAMSAAIHGGRVTLMRNDVHLAKRLRPGAFHAGT